MDYKQFADDVVRLVGGADNVINLEHCVTRLRFTLKDKSLADTAAIKQLNGVLGVVDTKQYQVVVGGEVVPTFEAIMQNYSFGKGKQAEVAPAPKSSLTLKSVWETLLDYLTGTMVQIIPLFIGCGLINCALSAGKTLFGLDSSTSTYAVMHAMANVPFYFLPALVGFAAAKKANCSQFLGATLGLFLMHPSFTGLVGAETTTFLGLPFLAISYSSSVFPVFFGVIILAQVEKFVYKILPKVLKTVFGPFLCLVIMGPLMIFIVGPAGYYFGQGLAKAVMALSKLPLGIGCGILAAVQPVLVLFGAHTVLVPSMAEAIAAVGFDALVRPGFIMASFAHTGASLAIMLKCKNPTIKGVATGATVTSFLGTNEPSMYALELPLVKPFICALAGAFCGGVASSLLGAHAYAVGKNGVFGWLVFEDTLPMIIIASAISCAVAFALTWIVGFDESKLTK